MEGDSGTLLIYGTPAGTIAGWSVHPAALGAGLTLRADGRFVAAFRGAPAARARLVSRGDRPSPRSPGSPGAAFWVEGSIAELTGTRLVLTNVTRVATNDIS